MGHMARYKKARDIQKAKIEKERELPDEMLLKIQLADVYD